MTQSTDFTELFGSLSREDMLSFLADLWSIRGWTTRQRDDTLVVIHPERDDRRRIWIPLQQTDEWERAVTRDVDPDTINVVISNQSDRGQSLANHFDAEFLYADDIREMVLYSIDRKEADRLCRAYFGPSTSIEDLIGNDQSRDHDDEPDNDSTVSRSISYPDDRDIAISHDTPDSATQDSDRTRDRFSLIAPLVAVLVIGGILLGGASMTVGFTHTGISGPDLDQGMAATLSEYPPGAGPEGLTNSTTLARAHAEILESREYRMIVLHNRSRGSLITSARWITARHRIGTTDQGISVRVNGTLPPPSIGTSERDIRFTVTARESSCHRNGIEEAESRVLDEPCPDGPELNDQVVRATATYLRRYLDTTKSTVFPVENAPVDSAQRYRIVAMGTPHEITGQVTNYTATVIVDQRGFIHRLTVEYVRQAFDGPEPVRFELRFHRGDPPQNDSRTHRCPSVSCL